jgi:hypothetical protein
VLIEVCGKSEGKIFKKKYRPAGILLDVNAMMYFRFNCNYKLKMIKITRI